MQGDGKRRAGNSPESEAGLSVFGAYPLRRGHEVEFPGGGAGLELIVEFHAIIRKRLIEPHRNCLEFLVELDRLDLKFLIKPCGRERRSAYGKA
ncbi:hypothetical protein SDC9_59109 [bioreactor metagenome]|uniref:Uncharacterized protein n=1 Tax=bioreactor metagenome TaxID=1076179 RepID=A0A644X993_9ZZZZ